ncbi:MAG: hypothetical protein ABIR03_06140 [Ginsengibacter sp.]
MSTIEMGTPLYEYTLKITGLVEYGVSLGELAAQKIPVPPEGARFDVAFAGEASGSKLSGKVSGIDYLYIRADGRFQLDVHAEITMEDGQKTSLKADGVAIQRKDSSIFDLRENVTLFSSSKDYLWVNTIQVWAIGTVDLATKFIHIKGYLV